MATQPTDTVKPRLRAPGDELTVIAQRAQAFTNASGTAIALSEGNADEIVCRARSGAAAPEVGTVLRLEGSFTGLCVQSGKELRCDDAETDTRVDTNAIRALGIRSMVVTPIRDENRVAGVLACFAPTAHAFTITHVAVLKTMADQISVLLHKERQTRVEGLPQAEHPPASPPLPVSVSSVPAPVVIKPASSSGNGTVAAPARNAFPVVSRVETLKPAEGRKERRSEVRASFGTLDAVGAEQAMSKANFKILGAVAVLVLAAISTFAILKMRKSNATPSPAQHAQEAPSQTATTTQQESPVANNAGSVPVNTPANPAPVASPSTNTVSARTVTAASENNRKPEKGSSTRAAERAVEEPAAKPTPATVALTTGPSRINSSRDSGQTAEIAPTLAVSGENVPNTLSALARPINSNSVSPAALVQSELEPMKVLRTVPPVYPAIARVRRLSGQVTIEITVGKDGKAHNPKLVTGQPIFRDAAFDAARQWVFKPAKLNGKLIEQTTRIKMDFHP